MDEEVRLRFPDRLGRAHTAPVGVDAKALAGRIRRPDEAKIPGLSRRRVKRPRDRFRHRASARKILEPHTHERPPIGRQARQIQPRDEVVRLDRNWSANPHRIVEILPEGSLDDEPRGAVGSAPDHGAVGQHVTDLNARGGPVAALDRTSRSLVPVAQRHHQAEPARRPNTVSFAGSGGVKRSAWRIARFQRLSWGRIRPRWPRLTPFPQGRSADRRRQPNPVYNPLDGRGGGAREPRTSIRFQIRTERRQQRCRWRASRVGDRGVVRQRRKRPLPDAGSGLGLTDGVRFVEPRYLADPK